MSRLPGSTENNREQITEDENRELARQDAAEAAARFGEPMPQTVCGVFNEYTRQIAWTDWLQVDFIRFGEACYRLGVEAGRAEMKAEWNAWLAKRMAEDPMTESLLDGATWRRHHVT